MNIFMGCFTCVTSMFYGDVITGIMMGGLKSYTMC